MARGFLAAALLFLLAAVLSAAGDDRSTYILHFRPSLSAAHRRLGDASAVTSILPPQLRRPQSLHLYTYSHATDAVAVRLTPAQSSFLQSHPSVASLIPDRRRRLHTTHSPSFLQLSPSSGLLPAAHLGVNTVIAVLDTGIYPSNRSSFTPAANLPPPPASFLGGCDETFDALSFCSYKLVGAKFYSKGYEAQHGPIDEMEESRSPLDTDGHGTHTASTAAGSVAPGASFFDFARGEARGVAPQARIAAYKVCWAGGCYDSDILAAMDDAIADGVSVISMSLGVRGPTPPFHLDSLAIGAFGAVRRGVVVSCSAGNSGPDPYSAVNTAPWILTVGASTVDREFPADVVLGDGSVYRGVSLYAGEPLDAKMLPLVYVSDCITGELDPENVAGKIVLCDDVPEAEYAVKAAGGAGMILAPTTEAYGEELDACSYLIAATMVGYRDGEAIRRYALLSSSPAATILFRGTVISSSPAAPKVAAFSGRGPNARAKEILKPDVIAPGVNILAAWTGAASPTDLAVDARRVEFNIISGTSMSCPHVSGVAALLRSAHPDWSPAAIKSAMMTTAYNVDNAGGIIGDLADGKASTPFVRGAGHVDPNRALNPGLVYDADDNDYIAFLCAVGYSATDIAAVFTRDGLPVNCSSGKLASPGDLNYPAFSVVFSSTTTAVTYRRTVRNVGSNVAAVYEAKVLSPAGVNVSVEPEKLAFDSAHQSLSYEVTVSAVDPVIPAAAEDYAFGSVVWTDGEHQVASAVAVIWALDDSAASS